MSRNTILPMQKLIVHAAILIFALLPSVSSTQKHTKRIIHESSHHKVLELSPKLSFQIILHGFLLWVSMGFLMPIAILVMRMSNRQKCGRRLKLIFYTHASLQILSVILVITATTLSVINFENFFDNTHQRIGLALYVAIWLPIVAGIFRPDKGSKRRGAWFCFHWLIGITVTLLGIVNIYTGLQAYHMKTMKSISVWNWLFSAEVAVIAFIYLLQEKWHYIKQSGVTVGNDSVRPTDQETSPTNEKNELSSMPSPEPC
ncbi:cytochrome b561 domain-containing protein At4g18260-like [Nicotiana tabacum]|uniref:Cytochrome b561 domain-containing protein At4g18260-like n=2 Tax=Nicotiana TaxID=4085 RepID=A0A1S4BP98_TOBAC|nr:PREDICTED: cytochrome b561 domain-containing protein At4g18260-like [Nicotiana sylvestris]XP_016490704.1 PREDICTED: cytochrome b561 domain-containing protein At4g18260-like [Nicotiana tabacum]